MMKPYHPKSLEIGIGGYLGHSYGLKWEDGHLVYRVYESGEQQAVLHLYPSKRSWEAFWKQMDAVGVWEWQDHYEPDYPTKDGTSWSVKLMVGDRFVESGGNNAYPVDGHCAGTDEMTPCFRKFLSAVRRLMGYVPFA
ncbi:MAG: hypothetical protein ACO36I_06815 [Candidatus Latescibacterota bacterium]